MANRIQGTTRLLGLLGQPIKHSLSPHMHNTAFEKIGEDYVYMCLEVGKDGLYQAIESLKLFGAKGGNITFPNKQEVIKYLDDISEDAKIIGSVNTIKIDDETKKITGYNTDGRGFVASIEELGIEYKDKKIVIMGVGGAGRAIAVQLAYSGAGEIVIKEIDEEKMREVRATIEKNIPNCKVKTVRTQEELKKELKDATLLVNATPLGMKGQENECAIEKSSVLDDTSAFVYDIVYEPRQTKLMEYAKENGLRTTNGVKMMLWQGAIAFEIWLGVPMPLEHIRKEMKF